MSATSHADVTPKKRGIYIMFASTGALFVGAALVTGTWGTQPLPTGAPAEKPGALAAIILVNLMWLAGMAVGIAEYRAGGEDAE